MSKFRRRIIITISILGLIVLLISLSGCIDSSTPTTNPNSFTPKPLVYGFATTITTDEKTELISLQDNYDKYDVEDNVGTVSYLGYTYTTHKITLWRGDSKIIINNVISYDIRKRYI